MAVITISRQFGSGGRLVAARVCQLLDYRYFDKEMIAQVAAEIGLSEHEVVDFSEEHYKGRNFMELLLRPGPYAVAEIPARIKDAGGIETTYLKKLDQAEFTNLIRGTILGAYERGNVVIVGRGGQAILAGLPGVLHVRLEAPLDTRLSQIEQQFGCTTGEAELWLADRDRAVAKYLADIFKIRPDDPQWYHLMINLGQWSLETAAQIIVHAVGLLQTK